MNSAFIWKHRSTCDRAQVGVVISRNGRILATGYNGAPSGMDHCDHSCNCKGLTLWDNPNHPPTCQSQQPCRKSVHAEANAFNFAARFGVGVDGAELHTTRVPCLPCAGSIINAGIRRVVWYEEHREMDGFLLLGQAGLEVVRWEA
jgi:dCMP deaminase